MTVRVDSSRYRPLTAGPVSLLFDEQTGGLLHLNVGERAVWRELVMLVRDDQWQTIPAFLTDVDIESQAGRFEIRFCASHESSGAPFVWSGQVTGTKDGRIHYRFNGEASAPFAANRIGFCLMHPAESCAGGRLRQHRNGGQVVDGRFPRLVEPQIVGRSSIRDLTGIDHEFAPGHWAAARFEGDIFETEDQRNWTDASFKTYCTPLEKPFPVTLQPGETRSQTVELFLADAPKQPAPTNPGEPVVARPRPERPLKPASAPSGASRAAPEFGLGLCAAGQGMAHINAAALSALCQELHVQFVRYDLVLPHNSGDEQAITEFIEVVSLASDCNVRLELALQLARHSSPDWKELARRLREAERLLHRIAVYRCGAPATSRADLVALRRAGVNLSVPIGGGSDANFCELNHAQAVGDFPSDLIDFVSWSINPQVHATDDLSLMETPQSLPAVIETARTCFPDKPLVVTPITLKPRFNAVGRGTDGQWPAPAPDPRQSQEIAAHWTRLTWEALSTAGAASTTWFEAFGPRGVAELSGRGEKKYSLFPIGESLKARPPF